jgi:fatty acid amide hydrolase
MVQSGNQRELSEPIYALEAKDLLAALDRGKLTSVAIVENLIERRRKLDRNINAFVAVCDGALEEAEAADRARKSGELIGPLHGLPITIKDNIDVKGLDSTLGLSQRVGQPSKSDAVLVAELRRAGAIILGKTNVPQLLLAQETENSVFGTTVNPWNHQRTPGGSSGGEAAAVAAGMTPWGIGTDIGGSIRIPAHFCGLVGLKPTLDRWSNRGSNTGIKGQELVRSQIGCLTRSVADATLLWQSVDPARMSADDPLVPPIPARSMDLSAIRGMTIGFVDDDDFLSPVPAIRRAVRRAREALEDAGAKVVSYWPVPSREILATWLAAISSDGGATMRAAIGSDPVSAQLKPSTTLARLPGPLKRSLGIVLSTFGEERLAMLMDIIGEKSVADLWKLTQERTDLRAREFDGWNRNNLDALICPPHVVPAIGLRESGDYALSLGPMFRWTLLNFPAGVVPVTRVQPDEEKGFDDSSDRIAKKTASVSLGSAGLPVGVQVVARPFQEETLLTIMAAIEERVRHDSTYPVTPVK